MKKIFALLFTFILLFSLFPPTARAADATISVNGTYDISTFDDGATVTINGGLSVTLTNTTDIVNKNISIVCAGANTRLGIDSLSISGSCALSFNGAGNILTLIGLSRLESGYGADPGIRVEEGTELTITGLGSVEAQGSFLGAGIGGGDGKSAGAITITGNAHVDAKTYLLLNGRGAGIGGGEGGGGGTITIGENAVVTAEGHDGGAGIGCGDGGSGGTVIIGGNATVSAYGGNDAAGIGGEGYTIEIGGSAQVTATGSSSGAGIGGGFSDDGYIIKIRGGKVTATSGSSAAGIGGGLHGDGGTIEISGGQVTATGSSSGAGIGGGYNGDGGTITVSGGQVTAESKGKGAGIGGGYSSTGTSGNGGDIDITGGLVLAKGGGLAQDIGKGEGGGDACTLGISGNSAVFFANDNFTAPTTGHTYFPMTYEDSDGSVYGVELPEEWLGASGYYVNVIKLKYDGNGAAGTAPDDYISLIYDNYTFTADDGDGLTYTNRYLWKWNTRADGKGTDYFRGTQYAIAGDLTLYAMWSPYVSGITLDKNTLSVDCLESSQLTAEIFPNNTDAKALWVSSDTSVASVDQNGLVKGKAAGTATITALAGGASDKCEVTVNKIAATGVSLNYGSKSMHVGEWFMLKATVSPSGTSDPSVTWKSSDSSVATVTNGVVTAVGTGSCTITATVGEISDTCKVTVKYEPKPKVDVSSVNISVNSAFTAVLYVGDTMMLSANVSPSDATDQSVTWQSTDSSIASVTSFGKVTAISAGSVTITAAAKDKTAAYSITVKSPEEPSATPVPSSGANPSPTQEQDTEDAAKPVVTVKLDTSQLPEDTKYIKLPNGDIIELNGEEEITVIVPQESVAADGTIEIVALDDGQVPLGSVNAEPAYTKTVSSSSGTPVWKIILVLVLGLAAGAVCTMIVVRLLIARKKS